jgi:[ribosomal protein S5]-alanine N-acetyltransferase
LPDFTPDRSRWLRFVDGRLIYLRDVTADDATDRYCGWLNDPEVNRYLETRFEPQTRDRVIAYIDAQNRSQHAVLLAIVRKTGDLHVGNLRLAIDPMHRTATLALFIGEKAAWGAGIGTEAVELATRYGFEQLNLRKLTARCYATNVGSIRAFEKAGWTREGRQRLQFVSDGAEVDGIWLGRCRIDG